MMRSLTVMVAAMAAGAWVFGSAAAVSSAGVIYSADGFESPTFTTGTPPSTEATINGQDGWLTTSATPDPDNVVIQSATVHGGSQAVQLKNAATDSTGNVRGIARYTQLVQEDHWVDVWVLPPSKDEIGANPVVRLRSGNGIELGVSFTGGGSVSGTTVNGIKYNVGEWNRVTIFVNRTDNNWDLYLNGTEVATDQAFDHTPTGHVDIKQYDIDWTAEAGSSGSGFFADDFQITTTNPVPEPGSMGLLAFGGWLLVRRRRVEDA